MKVTVVVVVVVFGDISRCAELVAAHVMSEEEGDAPVTRADFAKLFSTLVTMESKVSNLKRELVEEQEAAHERLDETG